MVLPFVTPKYFFPEKCYPLEWSGHSEPSWSQLELTAGVHGVLCASFVSTNCERVAEGGGVARRPRGVHGACPFLQEEVKNHSTCSSTSKWISESRLELQWWFFFSPEKRLNWFERILVKCIRGGVSWCNCREWVFWCMFWVCPSCTHVICHRSPAGADAAKDRCLGMVCVKDTVVSPLVGRGGSRWLFWLFLC